MHDGSITFSTALDNAQLEKDLAGLKKKIEKEERKIADLTSKRDKARKKSLSDMMALDAEKAKRQEIKDRLADIRARSKDKSLSMTQREDAKALIPSVTEELADQRVRVNAMQTEWNKLEQSVERYEAQIVTATEDLDRQKAEAGALQQQIAAADQARAEALASAEVADQRIVDLNRKLLELKERQKELEGTGIGLGHEEYDKNAAKIASITKELKEYQKALGDTGEAAGAQADRTAQAAAKMNSVLSKVISAMKASDSAALQGAGAAISAISPKAAAALAALKQVKAVADKAFEKITENMRSFLGALGKGVTAVKEFGKAAVKAFARAVMGLVELLDKINVFPKMFSSIGKSLKGLGRTVKSALVFSVIYKGLSMVRQQMGAYLLVNTQFSASLQRLKGVLLTAFQPIYDVVVPALTTLLNVLSRAIAAVAQFTAVLFGKTAKQTQKNAKDLYEQANATSAAGNATEEAAMQMASFDEINKLEGSKSAGGGGGVDVDAGPLFDWEYENTPFPDWGEAFDAFLDKILGNIPKLRDTLKSFAGWLNEWSKKVYDMFTFPGVLEKVKQIGHDLAEAFSDLVNWIDWHQLGQALGAGLNLALNLLTSFLYTFNWINLGQKLAEFINGLVLEIDWYEFGRLLWSGFKIGLETLAGFLLGLDMPQLAQAASNIVIGFFTEMKNTIEKIPWGEIGAQIASFLVNLDWYGMLSGVTSAIAAGLMAAVSAVLGFLDRIVLELDRIAREIVTALIEFFRDKVDWTLLAQAIGDGIAAALYFVAQLLDPELFYEIGKAIGDFLINLQWVEIFGGLTEILAAAISGAVAAVKGFLESVKPHLKEIADGIAEKINQFVRDVNWAELGQTISDGIEAALDFMIELMDQIDWDAIGTAICTFLENIDWETLLSKWGTLMGEFINAKLKAVDLSGALDVGMQILAGLAKGMWNKFQESGGVMGWLKSLLVDPIINGVKELFGIHSPSTVFAEIGVNLISGLFNGISETWHTITEFFGEKVGALKESLSEAWDNIKTTASEKWSSIKEVLGSKWDEIKTNAQ